MAPKQTLISALALSLTIFGCKDQHSIAPSQLKSSIENASYAYKGTNDVNLFDSLINNTQGDIELSTYSEFVASFNLNDIAVSNITPSGLDLVVHQKGLFFSMENLL